jgi:hypothetical protein
MNCGLVVNAVRPVLNLFSWKKKLDHPHFLEMGCLARGEDEAAVGGAA